MFLAAILFQGPATSLAAQPALTLKPIITGVNRPVAVTHAGDGSGRLFVTLQAGQIIIYDGEEVLPTPFLDILSLVGCCGERGLLSAAFHPNYASSGFFFVNYTNNSGDTVIARYSVSSDPNLADPDSAVILMTISQPFSNHNGGQLNFGADGYLYIGMGDGGSAGDPGDRAQDPAELLGKMLRIDVDGALPYGIPPTNPFIGDPSTRDEIWALGLRNPWRFSFDRLTGDLFIADVGQGSREEVSFQHRSSPGSENYGWRRMEGSICFNPPAACDNGLLTLPILEYSHSLGCSITGGYRYRGDRIQELYEMYVYGDYCSGRIWGAMEQGGEWTTTLLLDTSLSISTFGEDQNGELYVTDLSSSGTVYRLVSALDCDLAASYSSQTIEINFEIGTPIPATWNVWLSFQNTTVLLWSAPVPEIDPPVSIPISSQVPIPPVGTLGFLTTLTTQNEGIICSDWEVLDTGTPASSLPTVPELLGLLRGSRR